MPDVALNAPFDARQAALNRRRQLAQALQQMSMQPIQAPNVPGAAISPWQGVAQLAQALVGGIQNRKLDKEESQLAADVQAQRSQQIAGMMAPDADLTAGLASGDPAAQQLAGVLLQNRQRTAESTEDREAALRRLAIQLSGNRAESDLDRQARAQEAAERRSFEENQNAFDRINRWDIANIPGAPPRPPSATVTKTGADGKPHIFRQNPETGAYDIDEGIDYVKPTATPFPVVIQTGEGPQLVNRGSGTASPIKDQAGKAVGLPPTTQQRNLVTSLGNIDAVLGGISELSEKINTGKGIEAKAAGVAAKAAARLNYQDDVAEYQALIKGFTPLVARAVGHTGVLTQQDVDSVTALFPQPGDSKTLRDRKIARVKSVLASIQGQPAASADAATPAGVDPEVWAVMTPEEKALWPKN